jgi:GMP synthase (glutamine-hydrolysing)
MSKRALVVQQVPHENLGLIADVFQQAGIGYDYVPLEEVSGYDFRPSSVAALVVMGGPMNVDQTDRYPGLAIEVDWIRAAIAAELPVLGICLGSQLLAAALGANVYAGNTKEIGWYPIHLTDVASTDPVVSVCRPEEMVFQWHGCTFDLPAGAVRLASSELYPNQAFRYSRSAYALQFHLETTAEMIATWLDHPANTAELAGLEYIDAERIKQETPRRLPGALSLGRQLFGRFAQLCREGDDRGISSA